MIFLSSDEVSWLVYAPVLFYLITQERGKEKALDLLKFLFVHALVDPKAGKYQNTLQDPLRRASKCGAQLPRFPFKPPFQAHR